MEIFKMINGLTKHIQQSRTLGFHWAIFSGICNLMVIVTLASIVNFAGANQASAKPTDEEISKSRVLMKEILEALRSKQEISNLLVNSGVSTEAMQVIEKDLEKRIPAETVLPKMTLKQDQIFVDGKATGVRIVSYSPLKISYNKRHWTMSDRKSTEENYATLATFFEQRQIGSNISFLLFPRAHAGLFGNALSGALSGGIIAGLVGCGIAWATGGSYLGWGLGLGAGGALVGGIAGHNNYMYNYNQQKIREYNQVQQQQCRPPYCYSTTVR